MSEPRRVGRPGAARNIFLIYPYKEKSVFGFWLAVWALGI